MTEVSVPNGFVGDDRMSPNVLRPAVRPLWFLFISIALVTMALPAVRAAQYYDDKSLERHL
jgi:hypothetical protein